MLACLKLWSSIEIIRNAYRYWTSLTTKKPMIPNFRRSDSDRSSKIQKQGFFVVVLVLFVNPNFASSNIQENMSHFVRFLSLCLKRYIRF